MTSGSIDWGFSKSQTVATSSGSKVFTSQSEISPNRWRAKAKLAMALSSYGIGNFEDLVDNEILGNGTSFKVHACITRKTSELVAVKRLIRTDTDTRSREHFIDVLRKEFQVLSYEPLRDTTTLVNILGYGWNQCDDLPSVIIEYAAHGTMDKFLRLRGSFVGEAGWDLCRSLCLDVAVALEALHANGIIHGDVKLENVLVYDHKEKYATAKISDFGHSIFHITPGEAPSYLGTPIYNPPEILSRKNPYTSSNTIIDQLSKCDVWSFGLMVWCTIKAGKSYFEDHWLSQSRVYVDKLEFLIEQPPDYLQRASTKFVESFEKLRSAPASIKILFKELLWKCLDGDNANRCTMRHASILLDIKQNWQHIDSDAIRKGNWIDVEKVSFGNLEIFDLIDSDIPWHFRRALFEDLLETGNIQRSHVDHSHVSTSSCYITGHALSNYQEKEDDGNNQAGSIAVCYATGFGVAFNPERVIEYLTIEHGPSHTKIFLDRIKQAHGKLMSGNNLINDYAWFSESIYAYQQATHMAQRLNMANARFENLEIDLHKSSFDVSQLADAAAAYSNQDIEVSCQDGLVYSRPLLHFSVDMNYKEVGKLLNSGMNINQQDSEDRTALFEACAAGNLQLALLLLKSGASPSIPDSCGTFPLHLLIFFTRGDIDEICKALFNAGAEANVSMHQVKSWNLGWHGIAVTGTPLHVAVSCRNVEAIRALLSIGADVNYRVHFRSPLDIAVAFHLPDICELLIERGATVGKYWVTGRSPLHSFGDSSLCPSYGRWMIHGPAFVEAAAATIQLLIDHGLDIETEDIKETTSLSIAVRDRAQDLSDTKALLYAYRNLGLPVPPSTIFAAIESSSFTNSCSKITELAGFNLDLAIHDSNGNTPLHHCVIKRATVALRELITYPNINLDIQNQSGFTPLHLACKMNSLDCLEILCANGASLNEQVARSEDVALSLSLASGSIEAFYLLLQSNADIWLGKRTDSSNKSTILHKICDQQLFSQPMNPGFVSSTGLPTPHIPHYSLCEQVFKHRNSHILYDLLDRDPMLLGVINERGYTCLHVAIESANLYAVEILLQFGVDRIFRDGGRMGESLSKFVDSVRKDMRRWKGGYTDELDAVFDEIGKLIRNVVLG